MHSLSHLLLLATLLILSLSIIHVKARGKTPSQLVEEVCSRTGDTSSFCTKTLESDPRTSSARDFRALAKIALDLAVTNSTKTEAYIKNMLKKNAKPGKLKSALESCVASYEETIISFRSALVEIDEDKMSANYDAKVAGDGPLQCDQALESAGVKVESISMANQITYRFSVIGVEITDLL
ncbi:putative invertase inhibitor [Tripterygium wilfordii]|uniref:Putative invertase inhibitor n=1 Tax=Tripterygium wilfordii TaxID=458696 RepID=A0A7J7DSW2_TRIWF|nr:putative invertase inhibitor [Tripterygium wilfordii]KAF5749234.1 putative invertase inhibitor [Tripterygium wilfordii]